MNIEAMLISVRESGLNLYSKNYFSVKGVQDALLSGFIHAITLVSDEVIGKENIENYSTKAPHHLKGIKKMIELDFKYFNFFICENEDLRVVFILREKASERLKAQTAGLLAKIDLDFSGKFKDWSGDLLEINKIFPAIIDKYLDLYYKEYFKLNSMKEINRIKKEDQLSKIELRLLNVIISLTKNQENFYLKDSINLIHEKKKELVIEALESLIQRSIILPSS